MREALLDLLQVEGLPARTFGDAAAFLASAAVTEFGCLITDIRMPGIDGLELQKCLRARGSSIPIIFVTAYPEERIRARVLKAGAIDFLSKPFSEESLIGCLDTALSDNHVEGIAR